MSGSCCGVSAKSEPAKTAMTTARQETDAVAEQPAAKSDKNECCTDRPAKGKKRGCGC